jgi:hypothetical protein
VVFKGLASEKDGDKWLAVDPQSCEPLKTFLVERLVLADQINSRLAHLAMSRAAANLGARSESCEVGVPTNIIAAL